MQLPKEMIKKIPKDYFDPSKGTLKLLWEEEWRGLGITQVRTTKERTPRSRAATDCASGRVWDGSITKSMNRNHTSFSSSKPPPPQAKCRFPSNLGSGDPLTISHRYYTSSMRPPSKKFDTSLAQLFMYVSTSEYQPTTVCIKGICFRRG